MSSFLREHSWPVTGSVLLHGLLAGVLLLATSMNKRSSPPELQPLPIDAVVVDAQVFHAAQRALADRVAQEAARVQAAADAKAAAAAQADADARADDEAKADAARQADADAKSNAAAEAAAAAANEQAAAAAHAADQARVSAAAIAEAQRVTAAKKAADAKQAADAKLAADEKQAADVQARKDREAELRRQIADEEHSSAVASGPLRDRYITLLRNRIQQQWIKPPSARAGLDCLVEVTQVPGGEVTAARVTQCNGDAAVRQSIENAVYRSSPLPDPPDATLFERNFIFRFRPNE